MNDVRGFAVWVLLALWAAPLSSQRSYDPAVRNPDKQRDSVVDFALKQLNPQNTDYGCQLQAARKLAVDETVKRIDFWTILVTVSFLVLSFFMLVHGHRDGNRREMIAAEFLAQYHNAWVDARSQAESAIGRYNEIVLAANSDHERNLRSQLPDREPAATSADKPDASRDVRPQSAGTAVIAGNEKIVGNRGNRHQPQQSIASAVRPAEADLVAQIFTLQQQLNASHEREKHLQRELNKSQRRVPQAQGKNPTLLS